MVHRIPKRRAWRNVSLKRRQRIQHTRVWIDGREITHGCFYADPRRGIARVFVMDSRGNYKVDYIAGEIQKRELRGRVRVRVARRLRCWVGDYAYPSPSRR